MLVLAAFIWGTAFVAQRVGMDSIGPITFNATRMILAALAVGGVALVLRRRRPALTVREKRDTWLGGISCGLFLSAASIFQQTGLVETDAGKAGFITAMYLLLVPVIQYLLFRRRQPVRVWIAVGLGLAGMYLLCVRGDRLALTRGDALIFACAVMYSGHILCCGYFARGGWPIGISAIQFAVAALVSLGAAFLLEQPAWTQVTAASVPILYCGLISGGIGFTLQVIAQRYSDPTVASLLMSLESVFAVLAGAILLGERMSGRELLGCAVMLCAILLVQFRKDE